MDNMQFLTNYFNPLLLLECNNCYCHYTRNLPILHSVTVQSRNLHEGTVSAIILCSFINIPKVFLFKNISLVPFIYQISMKLSSSFLIIFGTLNNELIDLFYYYMVTTNNTQVTFMLTRSLCPFSLQTLTATSTFLSVDLLPLENSPHTRVRYRSLRTSPGRITSGKPIFRAIVTLPNTKCGFSSRTWK